MTDIEHNPDLVFVHLSDIHFRKGHVGDVHDIDAEIRNELERDLRTLRSKRFQKLDGIIISGDIAFAGQKEEYVYARSWIETVRELLDCPRRGVMLTPGNHDVDRTVIPNNGPIDGLHARVRADQTLDERDRVIADILRDPASGNSLFSAMGAYNDFAAEYDCAVSPAKPFWERDFALGNKATLRIRGMTTTLISSARDHGTTHKMAYGGAQRQLMRENNICRALVGHHPPSWSLEGDDADRVFSNRNVLQLFGHKHDQWFAKVENGVRLIAGAVHPDRRESNWEPRYSMVALKATQDQQVLLRIYPRRWSKEEIMFIGDFNSEGKDYRDHLATADTLV